MTTTPPRPPFRVSGIADLKHLNVRKEGPEDEKVLAVDLKLAFSGIDRAICDYFDDALAPFLWRHETSGLIARNAFLQPVAYMNEISSATVTIEGATFHGCEVKKFAVQPKDGGSIDLTCSVAIYPSSSDVADLAKSVQDGVTVLIEGPPDLFDGDSRATEAAPPPAASDGAPDPLLDEAQRVVLEHRRGSISLVQRHLRVGYNRAARLLEALEARGIVSAMAPDGNRKVTGGDR